MTITKTVTYVQKDLIKNFIIYIYIYNNYLIGLLSTQIANCHIVILSHVTPDMPEGDPRGEERRNTALHPAKLCFTPGETVFSTFMLYFNKFSRLNPLPFLENGGMRLIFASKEKFIKSCSPS